MRTMCFGEIVPYTPKLNHPGGILQLSASGEQMKHLFIYLDILNITTQSVNIFGVVKVNCYLY